MKQIIEYNILIDESYGDLTSMVNDFIKLGWQPLGGVCVRDMVGSLPTVFCQAIVKYENPCVKSTQ